MAQSRLTEWNPKDKITISFGCQVEQELTEMLQNPEIMRKQIEERKKGGHYKWRLIRKR